MPRPNPYRRKRTGRPIMAADIPFDNTKQIELLRDFVAALRSLSYKETTGLAYTLGVQRHTVERWKYLVRTPDPFTMMDVIDWVRRGKPSKRVTQDSIGRLM